MRICRFVKKRPPRRAEPSEDAPVNFSGEGTLRATVTVPYDQSMPWRQKWRDIATGVQTLQSTYAVNVIEHDALRQHVENLFADLHELADYLDHQEFGDRRTTRTELRNYHALDICEGFVNTTKHNIRD
jgi:hypothetical protein